MKPTDVLLMDGRRRQDTAAIIHTRTAELLRDVLATTGINWPLPHPPVVDALLPPIEPDTPEQVIEQAEGLFLSDRMSFNHLLEQCREAMIPHRLSLSADPQLEGEKWMLRRVDETARTILFGVAEGWLAFAMDRDAPDTTRWYVGIALFNGLCHTGDKLAENRGYHILESIALMSPPGRWPSRAEPGPHHIDWKPDKARAVKLMGDSGGIDATHWLMDALESGNDVRRLLVVEWMRSMLERPRLVTDMALAQRFEKISMGANDELAAALIATIPRLLEASKETGISLLTAFQNRNSKRVQMALCEILPSLLRRSLPDGLALLDSLSTSDEVSSRAAAVSALKELCSIDETEFVQRLRIFATDDEVAIRRQFVQCCLRDYLELDSTDSAGIFLPLWLEMDEVAGVRMRELLVRMQDVNPEAFSTIATKLLKESADSLDILWRTLRVRSEQRVEAWNLHLHENGPLPEPLL